MKQNKMEEQWLDEIRQTLADHEEELPADGWEKLTAAMSSAEEVQSVVAPSQPHIAPKWLRRAAVVALSGAIGAGGVYYFFDSPEPTTVPIASVEEVGATAEIPIVKMESPTEHQTSVQTGLSSKKKSTTSASNTDLIEEQAIAQETAKEIVQEGEPTTQEEANAKEPQEYPETLSDIHKEEKSVLLAMESAPDKKPASSRSWTLGMRLGRNGSADFDFGGQDAYSDLHNQLSSPNCPSDSTQNDSATRALLNAGNVTTPDEIVSSENHFSLSAGISVGKQLNNYLSLESGLVYTYLSSDVTLKLSGRQHQQLHYLGIPLKFSASIAEEGRWRFYADMGTMLEHSLYGKRGTENLHLNDWQWSMGGGLGLQYKLTDHMGLYLEPGVNYYFSNGTEVPSLRTESPFTFNLQIGVRFGL